MKVNKKQKIVRLKTKEFSNRGLKSLKKGGSVSEIGGPAGLEPTRFGDWEKNGRCSDF